jgi:hypothetical protein
VVKKKYLGLPELHLVVFVFWGHLMETKLTVTCIYRDIMLLSGQYHRERTR